MLIKMLNLEESKSLKSQNGEEDTRPSTPAAYPAGDRSPTLCSVRQAHVSPLGPSVSSILPCAPIRCPCALCSLILVLSTGNKHQQSSSSSRQPQSCVKQSAMLSRVHPIYSSSTKFPKCSALTSSISIVFELTRKAEPQVSL